MERRDIGVYRLIKSRRRRDVNNSNCNTISEFSVIFSRSTSLAIPTRIRALFCRVANLYTAKIKITCDLTNISILHAETESRALDLEQRRYGVRTVLEATYSECGKGTKRSNETVTKICMNCTNESLHVTEKNDIYLYEEYIYNKMITMWCI